MGDIADMHVEAYAAGLDPNEMAGADWADFYGLGTEPPSPSFYASAIGLECRGLLSAIDDLQEPTKFDASTEARAKALRDFIPGISWDVPGFIESLVALSELAIKREDELRAEETKKALLGCPVCNKLCKGPRGLQDHRKAKGH